jgi:hypothetical protein
MTIGSGTQKKRRDACFFRFSFNAENTKFVYIFTDIVRNLAMVKGPVARFFYQKTEESPEIAFPIF